MYQKVCAYIRQFHMLDDCKSVIVGFSGGADSVCLTNLLWQYCREQSVFLTAVSVHHGIRGKQADADIAFCEEFCRKRAIPFQAVYVDAPSYAKEHGCSVEEAGRILRYQAFDDAAARLEAPVKIAVAHHKNDQAETVLFHLCRGTDLRGMRGMLPVSGSRIRPLLCCSRAEIEAYLAEAHLNYRTDHTNFQLAYTRNRIRGQIIPTLNDMIHPQAMEHIAAYADRACAAEDYLELQTEAAYQKAVLEMENGLVLSGLGQEHPYLASRIVYKALSKMLGQEKDLTQLHVEQVLHLLTAQAGTSCDVRAGLKARRETDGIYLYFQENKEQEETPLAVSIPGRILLWDGKASCIFRLLPWNNEKKISNEVYTKFFDYDKIEGSLLIRHKQEKDYFILDAASHQKSLRRYMIDEKIPGRMREQMILLAEGDHVLWVIGGRISEAYKVSEHTKTVLQVQYCLSECDKGE